VGEKERENYSPEVITIHTLIKQDEREGKKNFNEEDGFDVLFLRRESWCC
jgi:hypothetical protein